MYRPEAEGSADPESLGRLWGVQGILSLGLRVSVPYFGNIYLGGTSIAYPLTQE